MIVRKKQEPGIFERELDVLDHGRQISQDIKYEPNELQQEFRNLLKAYEKLLHMTRKVFSISDLQGTALKKRELEIKSLLDHANQGFLMFDKTLMVQEQYSAECIRIFNKKPANENIAELLFQDATRSQEAIVLLKNLFHAEDNSRRNHWWEQLPKIANIGGRNIRLEFKWIGELGNPNQEQLVMLMMTDVTENMLSQAKLEFLSYHDSLTSLYNRAYAENKIFEMIGEGCYPIGFIMVDLNGLKLSNDVFGHDQGDRLLQRTAGLLKGCCRKADIVARWGGDEFLIVLPHTTVEHSKNVVDRIHAECMQSEPDPIKVSLAIGMEVMADSSSSFPTVLSVAEKMMYKEKLVESKAFRSRLITELEAILQEKGLEDFEHIGRLYEMSMKFAALLGFAPFSLEMKTLELLVKLHDAGRIAIPLHILKKRTALTEEEWTVLQYHSEVGYRLALSLGEALLAEAILAIHEHWDGTGYPYGLKGEQIPILSRMFAIVDVFDVITHDSPYKKSRSFEEALEEIRQSAGIQFDPSLVQVFLDNVDFIAHR